MVVITLVIVGAVMGALNARRRGGNRKDIAQYAVGYALAFSIVGMFLTVLLDRVLL